MMHTRTTLLLLFITATGCSASRAALKPTMASLPIAQPPPPKKLVENHFQGDQTARITEENLREVLAAPVMLDEKARVGIVSVTNQYQLDRDLPLAEVLTSLTSSLEQTGAFEVVTEVSADWPCGRGIGGLRELATRYRSEYLLLYRHRFVDRSYTNAWGFAYATLVGALFVPSQTIEAAGVLEATLFDVRTGTILFTAFARVDGQADENVWYPTRKKAALKTVLLEKATTHLTDEVTEKVHRLVAARKETNTEERSRHAPLTSTTTASLDL